MPENENLETKPEVTEKPKLSYEELEAELKNVRNEAASRRISNRELEEKAKQWEQYQESQKTEQQKLEDRIKQQEADLANYKLGELKRSVIKEFELDSEDEELLTGSDEVSIRKSAEKLKARLGSKKNDTPRPPDLLAGNRGTPMGGSNDSFDNFIRNMAKR